MAILRRSTINMKPNEIFGNYTPIQVVGKNIKKIREELGISQLQLARAFTEPLSQTAVSKWERGESIPNMDNIVEAASILGVHWIQLLLDESVFDKVIMEFRNNDRISPKTQRVINKIIQEIESNADDGQY